MGWQAVQKSSSNEWTWKPAFKKLDHREGITEGILSQSSAISTDLQKFLKANLRLK